MFEHDDAGTPGTVKKIQAPELDENAKKGEPVLNGNMDLIRNVKVRLSVMLGSTEMTVKDLFDLREHSVVVLNKLLGEPVDLLLEDKVIARGELVAADDNFGIRILEMAQKD